MVGDPGGLAGPREGTPNGAILVAGECLPIYGGENAPQKYRDGCSFPQRGVNCALRAIMRIVVGLIPMDGATALYPPLPDFALRTVTGSVSDADAEKWGRTLLRDRTGFGNDAGLMFQVILSQLAATGFLHPAQSPNRYNMRVCERVADGVWSPCGYVAEPSQDAPPIHTEVTFAKLGPPATGDVGATFTTQLPDTDKTSPCPNCGVPSRDFRLDYQQPTDHFQVGSRFAVRVMPTRTAGATAADPRGTLRLADIASATVRATRATYKAVAALLNDDRPHYETVTRTGDNWFHLNNVLLAPYPTAPVVVVVLEVTSFLCDEELTMAHFGELTGEHGSTVDYVPLGDTVAALTSPQLPHAYSITNSDMMRAHIEQGRFAVPEKVESLPTTGKFAAHTGEGVFGANAMPSVFPKESAAARARSRAERAREAFAYATQHTQGGDAATDAPAPAAAGNPHNPAPDDVDAVPHTPYAQPSAFTTSQDGGSIPRPEGKAAFEAAGRARSAPQASSAFVPKFTPGQRAPAASPSAPPSNGGAPKASAWKAGGFKDLNGASPAPSQPPADSPFGKQPPSRAPSYKSAFSAEPQPNAAPRPSAWKAGGFKDLNGAAPAPSPPPADSPFFDNSTSRASSFKSAFGAKSQPDAAAAADDDDNDPPLRGGGSPPDDPAYVHLPATAPVRLAPLPRMVRTLSINVASLSETSSARLLEEAVRTSADIVCIQEVWSRRDLAFGIFANAGWLLHEKLRPTGKHGGVLIACRKTLRVRQRELPADPPPRLDAVAIDVDLATGTVPIICAYMSPSRGPGSDPPHSPEEAAAAAAALGATPTVGRGDANVILQDSVQVDDAAPGTLRAWLGQLPRNAALHADINSRHPLWDASVDADAPAKQVASASENISRGSALLATGFSVVDAASRHPTRPISKTAPDVVAVRGNIVASRDCEPYVVSGLHTDHCLLSQRLGYGAFPPSAPQPTRSRVNWKAATPEQWTAFQKTLDDALAARNCAGPQSTHKLHRALTYEIGRCARLTLPFKAVSKAVDPLRHDVNVPSKTQLRRGRGGKDREYRPTDDDCVETVQEEQVARLRARIAGMQATEAYGLFRQTHEAPPVGEPVPIANIEDTFVNKHAGEDVDARTLPDYGAAAPPPPITDAEMTRALKHKLGQSEDGDGVQSRALRHIGPVARGLLQRLCSRALEGDVPQQWRVAVVVPLLKKGKPANEPSSYRPVALTSMLARTCEKIVSARITRYIPTSRQFGFRKNHTCHMAVSGLIDKARAGLGPLRLPNHVTDGKNAGLLYQKGWVVAVDFTDAFARVTRSAVLRRCRSLGVPEWALRFLAAFLIDRSIRVRHDGCLGRVCRLQRGVPQGTILGPLLWNAVMSELLAQLDPEIAATMSRMVSNKDGTERRRYSRDGPTAFQDGGVAFSDYAAYADDLTIVVGGRLEDVSRRHLQNLLDIVSRWAAVNSVKISKKTTVMRIARTVKTEASYTADPTIGGEPITPADPTRLLGFWIDKSLGITSTAAKLAVAMEGAIAPLKQMQAWSPADHVREAYCAYALSLASFAAPMLIDEHGEWQCNTRAADALEGLHNRACRAIGGTVATASNDACRRVAGFRSLRTTLAVISAKARTKASCVFGAEPGVEDELVDTTYMPYEKCDHVSFDYAVGKGVTAESPAYERLADTHLRLSRAPEADIVFYTDGSVQGRCCGGAAATCSALPDDPASDAFEIAPPLTPARVSPTPRVTAAAIGPAPPDVPASDAPEIAPHLTPTRVPGTPPPTNETLKSSSRIPIDAFCSSGDESSNAEFASCVSSSDDEGSSDDESTSCCSSSSTSTSSDDAESSTSFTTCVSTAAPPVWRQLLAPGPVPPPAPPPSTTTPTGTIVATDGAPAPAAAAAGALTQRPHPYDACSYTAETVAMLALLRWLVKLDALGVRRRVRIVTDSMSLLAALDVGHIDVRDAARHECWRLLLSLRNVSVHLVFAFGHCGLEGNEIADRAAKVAAQLPPVGKAWWKDAARAKWRPTVRADDAGAVRNGKLHLFPPTNTGPCFVTGLHARDAKVLARLRTGVWSKLVLSNTISKPCHRCLAPDALSRRGGAVRHMFECEDTAAVKYRQRNGNVPADATDALWPPLLRNEKPNRHALLKTTAYAQWFVKPPTPANLAGRLDPDDLDDPDDADLADPANGPP